MRIVIPLSVLQAHNACDAYLNSQEWDKGEQALVFPNWEATVERLLANGPAGVINLGWLVAKDLVPMTAGQFAEAKKRARGGPNG
jgi:hypothetical protein